MAEPSAEAKDKGVIGLGVVITLVSLIGAFALGDYAIHAVEATSSSSDPFYKYKDLGANANVTSQSVEGGGGTPQWLAIGDANVFSMVVELTWTDEADAARHTNQPDTFQLEVTAPDGRTSQGSAANVHGAPGSVVVTLERNITKEVQENKALKKKTADPTWTGKWTFNVTCTDAGDQTPSIGPDPIHLRDIVDSGNAWQLAIGWTFKSK